MKSGLSKLPFFIVFLFLGVISILLYILVYDSVVSTVHMYEFCRRVGNENIYIVVFNQTDYVDKCIGNRYLSKYNTSLEDGYHTSGFFSTYGGGHSIYLDKKLTGLDLPLTSYHEYAHIIYRLLPPWKRKEWIMLYEASSPDEFVTEYAKTNPSEDFAESYSYFMVRRKKLLKTSRRKAEWIFENVE